MGNIHSSYEFECCIKKKQDGEQQFSSQERATPQTITSAKATANTTNSITQSSPGIPKTNLPLTNISLPSREPSDWLDLKKESTLQNDFGNPKPRSLCGDARIYEYTQRSANPVMKKQPVEVHPAHLHESGPTRVINFDLSDQMNIDEPATSPNLLAAFVRICENEDIETRVTATSQVFYVIRGEGQSYTHAGIHNEGRVIEWKEGDLFVLPAGTYSHNKGCLHCAKKDTALYWVHDEPLLKYLGVAPVKEKFDVTLFKSEVMLKEVECISHGAGVRHKNRLGILLGNKQTEDNTLTLTHTLWSLLNVLPAKHKQRPHKHNSVALDLCVYAKKSESFYNQSKVYTLMGKELDENGWVKNPVRVDWSSGSAFTTPTGWWHSHHNDSDEDAWVLPMQDAGLYTHMRTLDIQFSQGVVKVREEKKMCEENDISDGSTQSFGIAQNVSTTFVPVPVQRRT